MKTLITGGAGFIGSHVAEAFLAAGHDVAVVDNLRTGSSQHVPPGARLYVTHVGSPEFSDILEKERPHLVSHHAAQVSVPVSARHPELDADINCVGLLRTLQMCVERGVGRFVFASSGGAIYGDTDQRPTPESAPLRPRSPYGIHKMVGEHYLEFFRREYGLQSITLRYGNVYGPRQDPHGEAGVIAVFIQKLLRGERPTIYAHPDEPLGMSRDYVYVEDVARANLRALETSVTGALNISGGDPVRTGDLFREIRCACDTHIAANVGPPRPGDVRESWLDVSYAADVLDWRPSVPLADGIARTVYDLRRRTSADR
jgi:UDP-glucose 4-epimerase